MNPPKMPLHIGDYKRDTGHLRAAGHGAYLLLLFHYWSTGALPDDDDQLSAIACMSRAEWKRMRPIIEPLFKPGWKHGRVDYELEKTRKIVEGNRIAGKASGRARAVEITKHSSKSVANPLNDRSTIVEPTLDTLRKKDSGSKYFRPPEVVGEDPRAKLFRIGKTILVSFGVAERRTGALIGQWLKSRNDPQGLLAAIQFARDQNVAEPVAYISAVLKQEKHNGTGQKSIKQRAQELADEWRQREHEAGLFRPPDDAGGH